MNPNCLVRPLLLAFILTPMIVSLASLARAEDAGPAETADAGPYRVVLREFGDADWIAVRYHCVTGQAWMAANGNWIAIEEPAELPPGNYSIACVNSPGKESDGWVAVRINTHTGESHRLSESKWVEMKVVEE